MFGLEIVEEINTRENTLNTIQIKTNSSGSSLSNTWLITIYLLTFNYVYSVTGQKMHYIGHSQGTVQMNIALSKRNSVVESLMDKYFAFGPIAYIANTKSNLVNLLDKSLLL
jgi:hypothetical protein